MNHDSYETEKHCRIRQSLRRNTLAFSVCLFWLTSGPFVPEKLVSWVLSTASGQTTGDEPSTDWIWVHPNSDTQKKILFKKQFQVDKDQTNGKLRFSPCYASLRVKIDGVLVDTASPYQGINETELAQPLSSGSHSLTVEAVGVDGPSAFFIELILANRGHAIKIIRSNTNWKASSSSISTQTGSTVETIVNLGPIESAFAHSSEQRVGINALDNYEQWKLALQGEEATAARFSIAEDFQIQEVPFSSTPETEPGSWVSMTIDPEGRLIIARESSGLIRLTLSAEGDSIQATEWINRDLKECRGLAFRGEELFANANNSKGLYRLRPDGNGFGEPELIYASSGGVGHGRNDLAVGPDKMLYSIHGDAVDLPRNALDHTSPYRDAAKGSKTREGHLLRINPDNRSVEIIAAGLRNPYGIDFNEHGDCFTYDADAEHDMGAPWYRPTRMIHLTTGGDFGWRGVTGAWPAYYPDHPDNAVPGLDIGKGSPTTVKFGSNSSFPAKYRKSLFVLDWAYGRILQVHLLPRGSSYSMTSETFLKGRPLNVTDLEFGANGSMYLITGGRKTQSKLYRVTYTGDQNSVEPAITKELTAHRENCHSFSARSRRLRHELEASLNGEITDKQFSQAWQQLGNTDPWISHAAARVIERMPIAKWEKKALHEMNPAIAVTAITCLIRSQQCQQPGRAIKRLVELARQTSDQVFQDCSHASVHEYAFYGVQLAISQNNGNPAKIAPDLIEILTKMYPAAKAKTAPNPDDAQFNYPANRFLSEILATFGGEQFVKKTLELVFQTTAPEQRLHFLYVLRNVDKGWTPKLRQTYFKYLAMAAEELGGAGLPEFLQQIREDAMKHVPAEERPNLAAIVNATSTSNQPTTPLLTPPRSIVQHWTVDQILGGKQLVGDKQRGKEIFRKAGCSHCHRFATEGHLIGPDLTAAMRRYSRRDLLTAIVSPSAVIADDYRSVQILTDDGRVITGQITRGGDFRSPILRIATDPQQPSRIIEMQKSNITSQKTSETSWMPEGLLDTFTRQQIFDLVAYLESSL